MADPADLAVLRLLPERLLSCGYVDAYVLYGVAHLRRGALARELSTLDPSLRPLVRLLALGEWVPLQALAPVFSADEVEALLRLGVLLRREEAVSLLGMVLVPLFGQQLFLPAPAGDPGAFFGEDTLALLSRMGPRAGRALVLYAGPGASALRAAALCQQVVAVEPDEVPRACAELNLVMNGVEDRVELRAAAPPPGERFDAVFASPPLMPFPAEVLGRPMPSAAAIFGGLPELLAPGGVAQGVCADLGGEAGPRLLRVLQEAAGELSVAVTVASSAPLHPSTSLCQRLIQIAAAGAGDGEQVAARALVYLEREGITRLYCLCVTLSASGAPGLRVSRQDMAGKGFWFR